MVKIGYQKEGRILKTEKIIQELKNIEMKLDMIIAMEKTDRIKKAAQKLSAKRKEKENV